ncbi:hypothetical protein VTJ83DRAFT_4576 [Remersonia thermophila]|uniref:Uncharacterized protein n=1 Tax=Remersonia thermophila TaxID=72144 RepID=A0ABR4DCD9_9PEZI
MPLWPLFRQKSRRRRGRPVTMGPAELEAMMSMGAGLPRSHTVPESSSVFDPSAPERQPSKRRKTEPKKLQRRPRAYSFSPGRDDVVEVRRKKSTKGSAPAGTDATRDETMWRVPTLRSKRDGDHLPRKLSRRRWKEQDRQREAEIKAMSTVAPARPAAEDWMAGRPSRKESKRAKTGFGVGFRASLDGNNRFSDMSLPLADPINEALSSDSDYISFKVSALEALAPRPTLRCSVNPRARARAGTWPCDTNDAFRRPCQRRRLAEPISEDALRAHSRVDSLADDLSASDIRELMERDQRRRERKRQLEQERLERRLARRAEKQKAAEAEAWRNGRDSPTNLERGGVLGREDVRFRMDPASAVVTSSTVRNSEDRFGHAADNAATGNHDSTGDRSRPDPQAAFHRADGHHVEPRENPPAPAKEPAMPLDPLTPKPSIFRRLSRSKSHRHSAMVAEPSASPTSGPDSDNKRLSRSWAAIFRWGSKRRRRSTDPSSFSNTLHDSMQAPPVPEPPPPVITSPPPRVTAGMPRRTLSRFREDLPERKLTPPASRRQSPDVEEPPSLIATSNKETDAEDDAPPSPSTFRPSSWQRSVEAMRQTPSTFSHPDEPGMSPEPHAMSLASIDSEGSWFSGRLSAKRTPSSILKQTSGLRFPVLRTPEFDHGHDHHHLDEMDITDDEYLSRVAWTPNDHLAPWNPDPCAARPSSDWGGEGEQAQWNFVKSQQPTVVLPSDNAAATRVKSHEVLKSFLDEGHLEYPETGSQQADDDTTTERGDGRTVVLSESA